jgi:hypothetical protein
MDPVYVDPDPSLRPARGEMRWDGVVVSADLERRLLVAELTGIGHPGSPVARNLLPRLVYLQFPADAAVRYRDVGQAYPLEAVRPGSRVSAVGPVSESRQVVREATFGLGAGR